MRSQHLKNNEEDIKTNEVKLKIMTQEDLYHFILSHLNNEKEFPANFDWQAELQKASFAPVFENIDFFKLMERLTKGGLKMHQFYKIVTDGIFKNIVFHNCNIRGRLINCQFIDCQFNECKLQASYYCKYRNSNFNKTSILNGNINSVIFENCHYDFCVFDKVNLEKITLINTSITNSKFTSTTFTKVDGLIESDYQTNEISEDISLWNTGWELNHYITFIVKQKHPTVVMLYNKQDGVVNADSLIGFLRKNYPDLKIILVPSSVGSDHPIFKEELVNNIAGIILPGGPNIPTHDKNDPRVKFETFLLEFAIKKRIPTIGICRGHQFIGHYFGAILDDYKDHSGGYMRVKKRENSIIYDRLDKKHQKWTATNDQYLSENETLKRDARGTFFYNTMCQHCQAIQFVKGTRDKAKIMIIVKDAKDKTVEGMEINGHIITFQHHHEIMFSNTPVDKTAKTLIKAFINMVRDYHQQHDKKLEQDTTKQHLNNF